MKLSEVRYKKTGIALFLTLLAIFWYLLQTPSNDRNWSQDQAMLPTAEFTGNTVTIRNIRNFSYTGEHDFVPSYYNRSFTLGEVTSVDYIVEPFGSIGGAHTFLSFGFRSGEQVAISIEIRKEKNEIFSPLKGILRNYELMYVIADERDVLPLRVHFREHNVYLYPMTLSHDEMKNLFIDMLTRANTLTKKPEFYNTITNNCLTNIVDHLNHISTKQIGWDYRFVFPSSSDKLFSELGLIGSSTAFSNFRAQHLINDKVEAAIDSPDFSVHIR